MKVASELLATNTAEGEVEVVAEECAVVHPQYLDCYFLGDVGEIRRGPIFSSPL